MRLRFVTIAAAMLFASACGGSDEAADDATDAAGETATTSAPATTSAEEVPAETETTAAAEPEETTTTEADSGDGSCLVGSWVITEEEMNAYYDALAADTSAGVDDFDINIIGQVTLDLDGSNYVYGAGFTLAIDAGGITGSGASTGGVSGTYTVADGVITTELGSSDLELTMEVAGITLSGSDLANGLLTDLPINNAPFDCAGPTLSFQSGADATVRHDVLLTPA